MNPLTLISLISASLTLINEAVPEIKRMVDKGDITPEQQKQLLDEIKTMRARTGSIFTGPEAAPSGR